MKDLDIPAFIGDTYKSLVILRRESENQNQYLIGVSMSIVSHWRTLVSDVASVVYKDYLSHKSNGK